jgi:hypothetical protein
VNQEFKQRVMWPGLRDTDSAREVASRFESLATKEPTHALGRKTRGALAAFQAGKLFKQFNLKELLEADRAADQNLAPESSANRGVHHSHSR